MDQVLFGNAKDNLNGSTVEYDMLAGGFGWHATENRRFAIMPSAGTISKLRIVMDGAPGAGTSYTFVLMVDGVASALTVTISGTDTEGTDLSNSVSVSAGQTVALRSTPADTPSSSVNMMHSVLFTGSTSKESVILGSGLGGTLDTANDEYDTVYMGSGVGPTTTEADHQLLVAAPGTIKNLYVHLSADPGDPVAPDGYRFTLRKNGASQSLTVTISADDTTGNDTSNSFTVAAGDKINLLIEPLNTPSVTPIASWGMTFVADTDGESLMLGGSDDENIASATEYRGIATFSTSTWGSGASAPVVKRAMGQVCTLKDLYIDLSAAPGAGNSFTFKFRLNDASLSNLSVTVSDTDTTGSDTSNTDILANDDHLVIQSVPAVTPTIAVVKWGFVQFIAPAGALGRGTLINKLEAAGII